MIKTVIVGATGFTGSELVRLVLEHPLLSLEMVTSESKAGQAFSRIHPQFLGLYDEPLHKMEEVFLINPELIFLALPHGVSMDAVKRFKDSGAKIVDLSADFRLDAPATFEEWYHQPHSFKEGFDYAVYGLPEVHLNRIKEASLVANPGCYPTASILGLLPLAEAGLLADKSVFIDAKSGTTGAGVKAKEGTHFCSVNDNFKAYGIATHRHTIEIEEKLTKAANSSLAIQFTPHLLPIDRGILASIYVPFIEESEEKILRMYKERYQSHPFVQLVDSPPELKHVRGTNNCRISIKKDYRTKNFIILSAIDNLMKGAAGQAVQNANLMFNFEETCGLNQIAFRP